MDLQLSNKLFVVLGASSGFGKSIADKLIAENASIVAVARRIDLLCQIAEKCNGKYEPMQADVTSPEFPDNLIKVINGRTLHGILINAGGPPAGSFLETNPSMWEDAFYKVLHWKVCLLQKLITQFIDAKYGRIVLIESVSVKQPVSQLVLSNSLRAAVAGMARTLADEVASHGITVNILAPGYHDTDAMKRLYIKRADFMQIDVETAREKFTDETGTGRLGNPDNFAELAVWLLSPSSEFVTGQVISVAGNQVRGIMG
jgi:3-oxoacyl-[acyl-carrier protein] reductase